MKRRASWLVVSALLVGCGARGCGGASTATGPSPSASTAAGPPSSAATGPSPSSSTAAGPAPSTAAGPAPSGGGVALGEALNVDPSAPARSPVITLCEGAPVAVWVEGTTVRASRWDGEAWAPLGGALRDDARGPKAPAVVTAAGRAPVVAWSDLAAGDKPAVLVALWNGAAWEKVGDRANDGAAGVDRVCLAGLGGQVVGYLEDTPEGRTLRVRSFDGQRWQDQAKGPVAAGPVRSLALATLPGGDVAVVFVEKQASGWAARCRRSFAGEWLDLPAPPGADGDSLDLQLVQAGGDGHLALAMSFNGGLRPILRLEHEGKAWQAVGLPEKAANPRGKVALAALGGDLFLAWPDDVVRVARLAGGDWRPVGALGAAGTAHDPSVVVGTDHAVHVAYSDSSDGRSRVRVVRFAR